MGQLKSAEQIIREKLISRGFKGIGALAPIISVVILWRVLTVESARPITLIVGLALLIIAVLASGIAPLSYRAKAGILFSTAILATVITLLNRGLEGHFLLVYTTSICVWLALYPDRKIYTAVLWLTPVLLATAMIGHLAGFYQAPLDLSEPNALAQRALNQIALLMVVVYFVAFTVDGFAEMRAQSARDQEELRRRNAELELTLEKLETLENLMSLCAWCGNVETAPGSGVWIPGDDYLSRHTEINIERQLCKSCYMQGLRAIAEPSS